MGTPEYAEVWCDECDQPATGPDAKCDTHTQRLTSWDKAVLRAVLLNSAEDNEKSGQPAEDDPPYMERVRKFCRDLAVEHRRIAAKLG